MYTVVRDRATARRTRENSDRRAVAFTTRPRLPALLSMAMLLAASQAAFAARPAPEDNPLLQPWSGPLGLPDFSRFSVSDFEPALDEALQRYRREIATITGERSSPTFDNTILALELAGDDLRRVRSVLSLLLNAQATKELSRLRQVSQPDLREERDDILLDPRLFARVQQVYQQRFESGLDAEQIRLVEVTFREFQRAGAQLEPGEKERLKEINRQLSSLSSQYRSNVTEATRDFVLWVDDEQRLSGLTAAMKWTARAEAASRGHPEGWAFGLSRSEFEDFMTYADDAELRRAMLQGYRGRGAYLSDEDNRALVRQLVQLRAERAELLGYPSHAAYRLETQMAQTPEQVERFLDRLWQPALNRAQLELQALERLKQLDGITDPLQPWDWWYYAGRFRSQEYDLGQGELSPYLELRHVQRGAFYAANRLFGVSFEPLFQPVGWDPNMQAWSVTDRDGNFLGVFVDDYFTRPGKRSGSWKSTLQPAVDVDGLKQRPIVLNSMNLRVPLEGQPALLNLREVGTVFHEIGHALHSLLTTVSYPSISGSSGSPVDYREFPAQFMERYATEPEVMRVYARHYLTGAPIPVELIARIQAVAWHNQGFRTIESISAALLDLQWHKLGADEAAAINDTLLFEQSLLQDIGTLPEIGPRYRSTYFTHIFSGGYSAGYYAYLWAEVLDADGFSAFTETGNIFHPELAERMKTWIFQAGAREDADHLYRNFRGRDPDVSAFLAARGLDSRPAANTQPD